MPSAIEIVQETIEKNPVVVFSKSYCPYCTKTKQLLYQIGAKYVVYELDRMDNDDELQNALQQITGACVFSGYINHV